MLNGDEREGLQGPGRVVYRNVQVSNCRGAMNSRFNLAHFSRMRLIYFADLVLKLADLHLIEFSF